MIVLRFTCLILILGLSQDLKSQTFLQTPIGGKFGQDFHIVFYVDWGLGNQEMDYQCLNKTYDGHQGTDFIIRSFKAMDSGVQVVAAADGVVVALQDGQFDREKESVISKGFGNFVALKHANGYYTYYAHLTKNSLQVKLGDSVTSGQHLANVGSSGNSSDPHLHFEVWWDSTILVDPFAGSCGNSNTLWLNPLPYDSSFNVWSSSLTNFIPFLDTLREEPPMVSHFSTFDSAITYWAILTGLRKLDTLTLEWFSPSGHSWFKFNYTMEQDMGYFYYWSYIDIPPTSEAGNWMVRLYRNRREVDRQTFTFIPNTKVSNSYSGGASPEFIVIPNPSSGLVRVMYQSSKQLACSLRILNAQGKVLKSWNIDANQNGDYEQLLDISEFPAGVYWILLDQDGMIKSMKMIKI